jgi:F-type H+-transporting ATPase subunit b
MGSGAWLLLAGSAAAAAETHGAEAHGGVPWLTLFFATVNFAVFFYAVVVRGILPSARSWAQARRERVIEAIAAAEQARADAERLRTEWADRMANLEREIAQIRELAVREAERERDRILAAARAAAAAIESDARRAAAYELRRAEAQVREEVARQARALAERLLRERLTPSDHERFVDDFLQRVPR